MMDTHLPTTQKSLYIRSWIFFSIPYSTHSPFLAQTRFLYGKLGY